MKKSKFKKLQVGDVVTFRTKNELYLLNNVVYENGEIVLNDIKGTWQYDEKDLSPFFGKDFIITNDYNGKIEICNGFELHRKMLR